MRPERLEADLAAALGRVDNLKDGLERLRSMEASAKAAYKAAEDAVKLKLAIQEGQAARAEFEAAAPAYVSAVTKLTTPIASVLVRVYHAAKLRDRSFPKVP